MVAIAKIDLLKMYDSISKDSKHKHSTGNSEEKERVIHYSVFFYPSIDKLENSEYDPQSSAEGHSKQLFKVDLQMSLDLDQMTLGKISEH